MFPGFFEFLACQNDEKTGEPATEAFEKVLHRKAVNE